MSTVSQPDFYLQWHDEGLTDGVWNGASVPAFDPSYTLDAWSIAPNSGNYLFHFSTKQSSAYTYTVFATITDPAAGRVYGAKFAAATPSACYLDFTPQSSLSFAAGRLISGDPKIQIRESPKQPPTCEMIWDGVGWKVAVGTGPSQPYTGDPVQLSPDADGLCTVNVTDEMATATSPSTCAVYYKDARNAPGVDVGLVQSQTALSSPRATAIPIKAPAGAGDPWQCTLELFAEIPSQHSELLFARS